MGFWDDYKANRSLDRLKDEQIYEIVHNEMSSGEKRAGLWAKAISQSDGNEQKAVSFYIKLRYQSIIDEIAIYNKSCHTAPAKPEPVNKKNKPNDKISDGALMFAFVGGIIVIILLISIMATN